MTTRGHVGLSAATRVELWTRCTAGDSLLAIALAVGKSQSTIYRAVQAQGGITLPRADHPQRRLGNCLEAAIPIDGGSREEQLENVLAPVVSDVWSADDPCNLPARGRASR